ncbi:MAG TPA: CDP-glycerol glycerophosphotransferase family protein [Candidatus Chromulinivoraceae bacterium]|nr:CDP-glycerol glycerophosphotransferase family protein [Candidatus Chromulinivoraceae bacterium]
MISKAKSIISYGVWAARYSVVNFCAIVATRLLRLGSEYEDAWLIAELPNEARDNGYWLYQFISEDHPEINVYYAIKRSSPDYDKLSNKKRVIEYGSFKHYLAHVSCVRSISTHIYGASPGRYFCRLFLPLMYKKEEVFLQHGILANVINLRGYNGVTIYTTDSEKDLFLKSGHKRPENLKQTGLARFDNLTDASSDSNILLVMPTFRSYLHDLSHTVSDNDFISSTFYANWNSLLNNIGFLDLVAKNNLRVIFYPHRQMQVFNHLWAFSDIITIGNPNDYDIQQLLRSAKLMITDYSSTYYDFMYMRKPAIVYQFDKNEVLGTHYQQSGSYPLAINLVSEEDVIDTLSKIIKSHYRLPKQAAREVDGFYPYEDTKNRQRIFAILSEEKKK